MVKLILAAFLILTGCSASITAGVAYINDVPASHITGHEQFHIGLEAEYKITDRLSCVSGWDHYSNGAQLGIGNYPNEGMDFFGFDVKYKFIGD